MEKSRAVFISSTFIQFIVTPVSCFFLHVNMKTFARGLQADSARANRTVKGTGGVSIFAVQIATALGAKVIATSSSDQNLQTVKGLGAVANQSVAATKAAGRIAQIGFLTGQTVQLNLMPLIFRQTTIRGIAVAPCLSFDRMNAFLNEHKIRPVIDHVYPFGQAREAYV